jgi:hypothetical protein
MFDRLRRGASADPEDVGIQTSAVLRSGLPWDQPARHFASRTRASGTGSLLRTTPASIWLAHSGLDSTMDAARRIGACERNRTFNCQLSVTRITRFGSGYSQPFRACGKAALM